MPRLSESMTDGKLLLWSVAVGDFVEAGDQIAEVEADKANMEIEAPVSGIICSLHGKSGDKIAVDTVLAEIREQVSHEAIKEEVDSSVAQPRENTDPTPHDDSPLQRRLNQFSDNRKDS